MNLKRKVLPALLLHLVYAHASSTFFVINTNNSGAGSFHQTIQIVNQFGAPGDKIEFSVGGTIALTSPLPPIMLSGLTIDTSGNAITLSSATASGLFTWPVSSPSLSPTLTISNTSGGSLTVSTTSVGGNGGQAGAGGALGAGGGIFVGPNTNVLIQGVTFSNCAAKGGNGSGSGTFAAGGGGGMNGGNGGGSDAHKFTIGGGGGGGGFGAAGGQSTAGTGGGGGGGGILAGGGSTSAVTLTGGGGGSDLNGGGNSSVGSGGSGGTGTTGSGGGGGGIGGSGGVGTGNSGGGGGGAGGNGGDAGPGLGGKAGICDDPGNITSPGAGGGGVGGGGGGTGSSATANGGDAGFAGGGGGCADNSTVAGARGGNGGFGGGGGAGSTQNKPPAQSKGGNGGFGGGGGGSADGNGNNGSGGFGGGVGGSANTGTVDAAPTGGGGGAMGGAIFVSNGATLTIQNSVSISGSSLAKGLGAGSGAGDGEEHGTDIFIMASGTMNFGHSNSLTIASVIESETATGGGAGGLIMSGTGTLQLGSSAPGPINTYAGSTTFDGGTTIVFSNDNLGLLGISPNPLVLGNGTLSINAGGFSTSRDLTLTALGTINTSFTATIDSFIHGSGGFIKTGSGTLILTNNTNGYLGATKFNGGTVQISSPGDLGASSSFSFDGGTLHLTTAFGTATFSQPTTINASGGTIFTETGVDVTFSGLISGSGALTKDGPGILVLTDTSNSYTGTNFNAGIVQISNPGNLGGGTLTFNGGTLELLVGFGTNTLAQLVTLNSTGTIQLDGPGVIATLNQSISGGGGLIQNGSGILILTGSNNYGGGTTVNGGTLEGTTDGLQGTITLNNFSSLIFDQTITGTFVGSIGGNGSVTKQNIGTVSLSGTTNNYSGTTFLNQGTLQISSVTNINGTSDLTFNGGTLELLSAFGTNTVTLPVTLNASGGTHQTDAGVAATLTTNIAGAGGLIKTGAGTLILTGINGYLGTTSFNGGIVQISTPGNLGANNFIFDGGTLELLPAFGTNSFTQSVTLNAGGGSIQMDNSVAATFSGNIIGPGALTKAGPGTMIFTGVDSAIGPTTVQSGTLVVNGTITTSTLTIDSGATLAGNGIVADIINYGTISPGQSIDTLTGTSVIFNGGSNYLVELNDTISDLLMATGGAGTVTINAGASLILSPLGLSNPQVSFYTVITATGGVIKNAPFQFINPDPNFKFVVAYESNAVLLVLESFNHYTAKGNAGAVANCFNALVNRFPLDLEDVFLILALQSQSQRQNSFNQMQTNDFNNIAFAQENIAERVRQIYTRHLAEQRIVSCPTESSWNLWLEPFYEHVHQRTQSQTSGYKENFAGFTVAVDYQFPKHWALTGGFSYAKAHLHIDASASSTIDNYAGSLGSIWTDSHWFCDAHFSYLFSLAHAKRHMSFTATRPGLTLHTKRKALHSQHSNEMLGHLGGGYYFKMRVGNHNRVYGYPFAGLDYIYMIQDSYKEHGAKSLNLKVSKKRYDLLRPEAGLGGAYRGCFDWGDITGDVSVSYAKELRYSGKKTKSSFKGTPCQFTVSGHQPKNSLICPMTAVGYVLSNKKVSFDLRYDGEYGKHFIENAVEGELKISF